MGMKKEEKEKAIKLRREGHSVKSIAKELSVSVGSVSAWVKDVCLDEKAKALLESKDPSSKLFVGTREWSGRLISQRARDVRKGYQLKGTTEVGDMDIHLAGCMLYWAEGAKNKNGVCLVNYDVDVLKIFVRFLRECYNVSNERFVINIVVYDDDGENSVKYWLEQLNLPRTCLRKVRRVFSEPKCKKNRYLYGGCSVSVHNTEIVQRIFGSIKAYTGVMDERWLD
jgi:transposase-like protein